MFFQKLSNSLLSGSRHLLQWSRFQSLWLETSLGKVHYFHGKGQGVLPPMLFIHGLGAQAAELSPVFWRLRKYCSDVIAIDLPVHGWSESPKDEVTPQTLQTMLNEALDQLLAPFPPVLIFGNSLGGLSAIRYTNHNPDNIGSMVLSSPGGAPVQPEQLLHLREIFTHITQDNPKEFVSRLYNQLPSYSWLIEKEIQMRYAKSDLRKVMAFFQIEHLLHPDELHSIHVPTLLLWGQEDRILEEHIHFWREHLPTRWRLEEPTHFTHCPYLEMPEELSLRIRDFARFNRHQQLRI